MRAAKTIAILLAALSVGLLRAGPKEASEIRPKRLWADATTNLLGMPSPDGRYLSFLDQATGDLALWEIATGKQRRLTANQPGSGQFAYFSAISADSRRVAYAWFNEERFYELRVVGVDGGSPRTLYRNPERGFVQPCAWSPDGKQILTLFFRKDNVSQIALLSAADGAVRTLKTLSWFYPKKMAFSPDGQYIAYDSILSRDSEARDIYALKVDGSREFKLVEHPANDIFPLWSPDGKALVFASDRGGSMDVWALAIRDGEPRGEPRLLTKSVGRLLPMGITSDGAYFFGLRTGETNVHVGRLRARRGVLDGTPAIAGRKIRGGNVRPDWSPDGKRLAYLSRLGTENYGQESRAIIIWTPKTGEERVLMAQLAYIDRIRWSPDGKTLLASGSDGKGRGGLFAVDAATGRVRGVVREKTNRFRGFEGGWSPDGKAVYYIHVSESGAHVLRRFRVKDRSIQDVFRPAKGAILHELALSPDGEWAALAMRELGSEAEVLLGVPIRGGEQRQLMRVRNGKLTGVEWASSGESLYVSTPGKAAPALWRVSLDGGMPERLALELEREGGIRLHPDGRRFAYTLNQERNEVWAFDALVQAALPEVSP